MKVKNDFKWIRAHKTHPDMLFIRYCARSDICYDGLHPLKSISKGNFSKVNSEESQDHEQPLYHGYFQHPQGKSWGSQLH